MNLVAVGAWVWLCGFLLLSLEEDFELKIADGPVYFFACVFVWIGPTLIVAGFVELIWRSFT